MKKLSLLLLASVFAFYGCSNDDDEKNEVLISFENLITEPESEFVTEEGEVEGYYFKYLINDPQNLIQLNHYYGNWGFGGGFTYTNKTDKTTTGYSNISAITAKGVNGKTYLTAKSDAYTTARITNMQPDRYEFKGAWVTNTTYDYLAIKDGNDGGGIVKGPFQNGDWFKLTAVGHKANGDEIGRVDFYLADYRNGKKEVVSSWKWFDWSIIEDAHYITFEMSSTDNNELSQMNTPSYFSMDGITLIED